MNISVIINELKFKAIRSSGAGGQHVNKVASKIELTFDLLASKGLNDHEKKILSQKLSSRITKSGFLILQCADHRSQHRNKEYVIKRLLDMIKNNLITPPKRKPTKPSKKVIEKRLDYKRKQALKKINRKKPLL